MKTFQIKAFSKYLLKSGHWRGHGIHSPFMYDFVRNTLMKASKRSDASAYTKTLRSTAPKYISKSNFGATPSQKQIETKSLIRRISIHKKYGKLLNSMVANYAPKRVLELGTGLGISTYYLANQNKESQVTSVEGMTQYAEIASTVFEKLGLENVTIVNKKFDEYFDNLADSEQFGLFYVDGAHTSKAMLPMFEKLLSHATDDAIIIFDDIRWSSDMFSAWQTMSQHPKAQATVDLGRIGIIMLDQTPQKQHHTIRY